MVPEKSDAMCELMDTNADSATVMIQIECKALAAPIHCSGILSPKSLRKQLRIERKRGTGPIAKDPYIFKARCNDLLRN